MKTKLDGNISNLDCIKAIKAQNKKVYGALSEFLRDFHCEDIQVLISLFATFEFDELRN